MLRKRTVFKPNLNQAAGPKAPTPVAAATQQEPAKETNSTDLNATVLTASNASPTSPIKSTSLQVEVAKDATTDSTLVALDAVDSAPLVEPSLTTTVSKTKEIDDESSKRVHEAITQLTGQRFEPIKSISLRNSANKNVKLKDLLFYNPPLTKDQKRHRKNLHLAKKNEKKKLEEQNEQVKPTDDNNKSTDDSNYKNDSAEMDTDEPSLVPKVKMGPEGQLILDESSTIINRKNSIKEKEAIIEDNEEIISRTNYDSYRRKPASTSQTKWSVDDTQKFYQALTIFGTDFSMMESLLFSGYRNRTELHKKFKREERINKTKIDFALSNRISITSDELDELRDLFHKT
jgi:transcription factor TFIIIB component B''